MLLRSSSSARLAPRAIWSLAALLSIRAAAALVEPAVGPPAHQIADTVIKPAVEPVAEPAIKPAVGPPVEPVAKPVVFQQGNYVVRTVAVPELNANSVTTCTAMSDWQTITTTVPLWSCTACQSPYNAIFPSPVDLWGPAGIPSPPPGYPVLNIVSGTLAPGGWSEPTSSYAAPFYSYASPAPQDSPQETSSPWAESLDKSTSGSSVTMHYDDSSIPSTPDSSLGVTDLPEVAASSVNPAPGTTDLSKVTRLAMNEIANYPHTTTSDTMTTAIDVSKTTSGGTEATSVVSKTTPHDPDPAVKCEAQNPSSRYILNKDEAESEIERFCDESKGKPVYAHGSVHDDAKIQGYPTNILHPDTAMYMYVGASSDARCKDTRGIKLDKDTCVDGLNATITECDLDSSLSKGGTLHKDCLQFSVKAIDMPESKAKPKFAICERIYQSDFDLLGIVGTNWGLTEDGKEVDPKLKKELEACGYMADSWEFDHFTDKFVKDSNFFTNANFKSTTETDSNGTVFTAEWRIIFTLPRDSSNCVGRAIEAGGGPKLKCVMA